MIQLYVVEAVGAVPARLQVLGKQLFLFLFRYLLFTDILNYRFRVRMGMQTNNFMFKTQQLRVFCPKVYHLNRMPISTSVRGRVTFEA